MERELRRKGLKVVQRLMNATLVSAFERWLDFAVEMKKMKKCVIKVVLRIKVSLCFVYFAVCSAKHTQTISYNFMYAVICV